MRGRTMPQLPDEFAWIASLRPLTRGDARARNLADDAAVLPARSGFDLVISADAMVEGVHVLEGEAPAIVARRALRCALSDLAAKAAEPFGYLLAVAFPPDRDQAWRAAFAGGLAEDGERFGVALLGGDTVSTTGPLAADLTVFGWVPAGGAPSRAGARAGDRLVACGTIGDGALGLRAARGEPLEGGAWLANRYRLPEPLFALREALRAYAHASADVSDGLIADAMHIADASGLGLELDLARLPLSEPASAWLAAQPERAAALSELATGGDDYAIVCAVDGADEDDFLIAARAAAVAAQPVGRFITTGGKIELTCDGRGLPPPRRAGWRH